jgi:uncharacterized protein YgbK (DUF1537 family)
MRIHFTLLLAIATLVGCSGSDSTDKGSAPTITDVTLDKTEITVGSLETIKITVAYADPDGDVAKVDNQLVPQGGTSQPPGSLDIHEAAGQKEGTQAFALQIAAPAAGNADVVFWLVDARGNESQKVTKTITAK